MADICLYMFAVVICSMPFFLFTSRKNLPVPETMIKVQVRYLQRYISDRCLQLIHVGDDLIQLLRRFFLAIAKPHGADRKVVSPEIDHGIGRIF
jgi:hypothetical protein